VSGGVDPRAEAVRGLSVCVGRRRGRVVIGSGSASSEGARGPRDVIQSACAKSIFLKAYCTLFAAAGWAARPCTSRGRSSIYSHTWRAAPAGGASVQRLAARSAERDSLNAPRNREALYALAQAGRRGVRVDGTRQVQSAESHAA
jgi:hypothetical protein